MPQGAAIRRAPCQNAPVSGPPPPPRAARDVAGSGELCSEIAELETPELLALCARFQRDPERLSAYLELFRARLGPRAQFAACLVCFDIARLGVESAQREFSALAPTMVAIAADPQVIRDLLGEDPYLQAIWSDCQRALRRADPRDFHEQPQAAAPLVGELDLLSEEEIDLSDLEPDLSDGPGERARHGSAEFSRRVAEQIGEDLEHGLTSSGHAFALDTRAEIDRFERFVAEAVSRASEMPLAAGVACLGNLFLASHLRRTNLFGAANPRRSAALQAGLNAIRGAWPGVANAASLFAREGPEVIERFQKVSELLLDFLRFCAAEKRDPLAPEAVERYVRENRDPEPLLLKAGSGRRRR